MIAPADGRQWVKREEQEPVIEPEQWMTRRAEIEAEALAKRQVGFLFTLGNAVFSIGLNSNGLPAFTVTAPQPPPPPATATPTRINTPANTNVPAPTPTPIVPQPTIAQPPPVNTRPANTEPDPATVPLPSDPTIPEDTPADSSTRIVNTESGNTALPTRPLITPGAPLPTGIGGSSGSSGSSGNSGRSSATDSSSSRSTRTGTGPFTTTQVIFAGGTPVTSIMTMGQAATPQPSNQLSPPQIAGAVVGAVGGTAALLLLIVLCVRWRRHVKDNKRISRGGESIKALHTGPAPMMAHNSARYTNVFPQGGAVAVDDDAHSSKVAFLPAGAAGFLNRSSGSPLSAEPGQNPAQNNYQNSNAQRGISEQLAPSMPAPPSPTVAHSSQHMSMAYPGSQHPSMAFPGSQHPSMAYPGSQHPSAVYPSQHVSMAYPSSQHGSVAFLAADASSWLNRNSSGHFMQPAPPSPHHGPVQMVAVPMAALSRNGSTHSLPSQLGLVPHNGQVAFLPADASGFLNRASTVSGHPPSPSQAQHPPVPPIPVIHGGPAGPMGTPSHNTSTRSLPYDSAPGSQIGAVTFLPALASGFLNKNSTVGSPSHIGSAPTAAGSSTRSLPSQVPSQTQNVQMAFLPANASGFLNQGTNNPIQPGPASEQSAGTGPSEQPSFQKISGYKVPSPFDNAATAGPSSVNFSAPAAGLAVPTPAHMMPRDSAGTASNHSINNNSEWFGSDYHDSREMPAAAVSAAAARSSTHTEVDEMLDGPNPTAPGQRHPPSPLQQELFQNNPFDRPSAPSSPEPGNANPSQQGHTGHASFHPGPQRTPEVRDTMPPQPAPGQEYNAQWGAMPQWPGVEGSQSWYTPQSPDAMGRGQPQAPGGSHGTSWPKPPDVDWERPRVRPKDAF